MTSNNDNYPDDIRRYDDDPRSPFYEDPDEWMEEPAIELSDAWDAELKSTQEVADLDLTLAEIMNKIDTDSDDAILMFLFEQAKQYISDRREQYLPDLEWD